MKTKIIIGSLAAVFLLLILPSISAVEFNIVVESNRQRIIEKIHKMNIDENDIPLLWYIIDLLITLMLMPLWLILDILEILGLYSSFQKY